MARYRGLSAVLMTAAHCAALVAKMGLGFCGGAAYRLRERVAKRAQRRMLLAPGAHRGVQGAVWALWQMHKPHPGLQRREKCRGHRARMTGAREIGLQKRIRGFKKYIGFKAMLAAKSVEELA